MSLLRHLSVATVGLVLFGAMGCGSSTAPAPPAESEAAIKSSQELDQQWKQMEAKDKGKKK
jgi:hypothetical protein